MRTLALAGLVLALGVTMAKRTAAQEKKAQEPTEFVFEGTTFNERVTVKRKKPATKTDEFFDPVKDVWAVRKTVPQKGLMFMVAGTTRPGADLAKDPGFFRIEPGVGSVLTDAAGNEYTVTEVDGFARWVKLTKAAPKKPEKKP
jgi:hypothetical protein